MADVLEHLHAAGRMSISSVEQPIDFIRRRACSSVRALVAKPGIVTARIFFRGVPRRSIARAHTSSAWVESMPPETPITTRSSPVERIRRREALHLDVEDFGASLVARRGIRGHVREALVAPLQGHLAAAWQLA